MALINAAVGGRTYPIHPPKQIPQSAHLWKHHKEIRRKRDEKKGGGTHLVDKDEDRLLRRQLDAFSNDVDELAYGQVGGNEVLPAVATPSSNRGSVDMDSEGGGGGSGGGGRMGGRDGLLVDRGDV